MRGGVVAHGGETNVGIDYGIDFVADTNWLFGDDLVRAHALNGRVAAFHFGDDGVVIAGIEPTAITNLATRFGIEGRVIEDDLTFVAGLEFLCSLAVLDNGQHFAVVGASLAVAFEG